MDSTDKLGFQVEYVFSWVLTPHRRRSSLAFGAFSGSVSDWDGSGSVFLRLRGFFDLSLRFPSVRRELRSEFRSKRRRPRHAESVFSLGERRYHRCHPVPLRQVMPVIFSSVEFLRLQRSRHLLETLLSFWLA